MDKLHKEAYAQDCIRMHNNTLKPLLLHGLLGWIPCIPNRLKEHQPSCEPSVIQPLICGGGVHGLESQLWTDCPIVSIVCLLLSWWMQQFLSLYASMSVCQCVSLRGEGETFKGSRFHHSIPPTERKAKVIHIQSPVALAQTFTAWPLTRQHTTCGKLRSTSWPDVPKTLKDSDWLLKYRSRPYSWPLLLAWAGFSGPLNFSIKLLLQDL